MKKYEVSVSWRLYDLWIGAYYDEEDHILFVSVVPTVVIAIYRRY